MITTIWIIYFIMLILSLMSLIKAIIHRKKKGIDLTLPNFCSSCMRKLNGFETIPILSFIILKGECRYCKAEIPLI